VRFFELMRPVTVGTPAANAAATDEPRSSRRLTTDQLIEMMFFTFPNDKAGFHFTIPCEALGGHRAFFDFILNELDLGHRRAALESSTTFEQLRIYARAVALAEQLNVDLLVD